MRMMTVPGVGPIGALTFKAAVDDPARFKRSRTVAAHFGLTPRRYQSGERDNPGRISNAGDRDVRTTLAATANLLQLHAKWPSYSTAFGSTAPDSVRNRCEERHDLNCQTPNLTGSSSPDEVRALSGM